MAGIDDIDGSCREVIGGQPMESEICILVRKIIIIIFVLYHVYVLGFFNLTIEGVVLGRINI